MRAPKTNFSLGQMSYNLPEDVDRLRWNIKKIVDNLDKILTMSTILTWTA